MTSFYYQKIKHLSSQKRKVLEPGWISTLEAMFLGTMLGLPDRLKLSTAVEWVDVRDALRHSLHSIYIYKSLHSNWMELVVTNMLSLEKCANI